MSAGHPRTVVEMTPALRRELERARKARELPPYRPHPESRAAKRTGLGPTCADGCGTSVHKEGARCLTCAAHARHQTRRAKAAMKATKRARRFSREPKRIGADGLTDLQRHALTTIRELRAGLGRMPSYAEIAAALDVTPKGVQHYIRALDDAGYMRYDPALRRRVLVDAPEGECAA